MRSILAKFILVNRWLAAAFLVGLTVALSIFAARFITNSPSSAPMPSGRRKTRRCSTCCTGSTGRSSPRWW